VEAVVDALLVLPGNAQPARVSTLSGGDDDLARAVASLRCRRDEEPVLFLRERYERLFHAHVEVVLVDDLAPAREELLLLRAVEPELPPGRHGIGLGVDPLSLGEVLDRAGDLLLLEHETREASIARGEGGIETGGARADDEDVESAVDVGRGQVLVAV